MSSGLGHGDGATRESPLFVTAGAENSTVASLLLTKFFSGRGNLKRNLRELMHWVGVMVGDNILLDCRASVGASTAEVFCHAASPTLSDFILVHPWTQIRIAYSRMVSTLKATSTVGNKQPWMICP
jgi:hypothetical protein